MTDPSKNRQRGKNTERAIAKLMDGVRLGILGKVDVETEDFSIEVKDRKKSTVHGFMEQAVRHSGDKTPMVVIHKTGSRHDNDLVCLKMVDYLKWYDPKGKP